MSSNRHQILVFRELPEDQLARLQAAHDVTVANPRVAAQRDAFFAALPQAQALIGSSYPITDALLDEAPQLRVISSISVGVDNYPLASLRERGIALCHTPGVLTETTADTIFALLMATSRRIPELAMYVRSGQWQRNIGEELFGWDVHGKTLGILGMGRIGMALARRAALGFGMRVLYNNRSVVPESELGTLAGQVHYVARDALMREADFVVSVVPSTPETKHLLGADAFAMMKPSAIVINGSRGAIVDEAALLHALDTDQIRAAGLDVFATEPLPVESPLRTHAKVVALPHIGSATHETRHAMAEMATSNLLQVLAGEKPAGGFDLSQA
ncbi:D-glycerate dehydrogenase [Comamonas sp. JNW]|uniref:2-hydroxyacid dehydrogenase n=1 Tax=Comamonas sp. JNW TaxID=2170731 RepID=UPI000DE6EB8C|nr:D-glycerate dehydrogenase [Comamonas sp. JNW]PWB19167.1 bifunctional glyoxylate/hydroxypyruvate reductase B [Comamonas sp. JNW]